MRDRFTDKKKRKSFTIIEIMIVISVLLILAAIAIPGLLRTRLAANETIAIRNLRSISDATIMFRSANSVYPADLSVLASSQPAYLDQAISIGTRSGYNFVLTGGTSTFTATARPQGYRTTGVRSFFIDEDGVMHWTDQDTTATALDQPIS